MSDPDIIYSGLSREIEENGVHLQIEIYRLKRDPHWILEVVDKDGTSTVWDETFETDQAALDEALKTIREDGTSAFRDQGNVISFPKNVIPFTKK